MFLFEISKDFKIIYKISCYTYRSKYYIAVEISLLHANHSVSVFSILKVFTLCIHFIRDVVYSITFINKNCALVIANYRSGLLCTPNMGCTNNPFLNTKVGVQGKCTTVRLIKH